MALVVEPREAYVAARASALAGVPLRTVRYWQKIGLYAPSVSPERVRLYSLADVVTLRAIYWMRSPKGWVGDDEEGKFDVKPTRMREVRRAVEAIMSGAPDLTLHSLTVNLAGDVFFQRRDTVESVGGQTASPLVRDVLRSFKTEVGLGPDLGQPRPLLRILSGKLGGEPHVDGTRVRTSDIDGLIESGYREEDVLDFYPFVSIDHVRQARDLEAQLRHNLKAA